MNHQMHDVRLCAMCCDWAEQVKTLDNLVRNKAIGARAQIAFLSELCTGHTAEHIATTIMDGLLADLRRKLARLEKHMARARVA